MIYPGQDMNYCNAFDACERYCGIPNPVREKSDICGKELTFEEFTRKYGSPFDQFNPKDRSLVEAFVEGYNNQRVVFSPFTHLRALWNEEFKKEMDAYVQANKKGLEARIRDAFRKNEH